VGQKYTKKFILQNIFLCGQIQGNHGAHDTHDRDETEVIAIRCGLKSLNIGLFFFMYPAIRSGIFVLAVKVENDEKESGMFPGMDL